MKLFSSIFVLVTGFTFLTTGAKLLCDSAISIAGKLGISSVATGIFLVSIGTSAPDLVSCVTAILKGHPEFSIGNILGSNFINLTLGFGVASMVKPFRCEKKVTKVEFPLLFLLTLFFTFFCLNGRLSRGEGAILLAIFCANIFFTFSKKVTDGVVAGGVNGQTGHNWPMGKGIIIFAVSAFLLAFGAHMVVGKCFEIANLFGMSKTFVGFSLMAFGTSAPEIFVVAMAAKHGRHSICAGNIMGSSLINLMFVSGLCAVVHPIEFEKDIFVPKAMALIFVTVLSWYVFRTRKIFSRAWGATFAAIYLTVMVFFGI
jgi:cation:H+ antiporter